MESNDFVLLGGGFILGVLGYQLYKRNPEFLKSLEPKTQTPQGGGFQTQLPPNTNIPLGAGAIVPINDAKSNIVSMLNQKYGQSQDNADHLEEQAKKSLSYEDYIYGWSSAIMRGETIFVVCDKVNINNCKTYYTETGLEK